MKKKLHTKYVALVALTQIVSCIIATAIPKATASQTGPARARITAIDGKIATIETSVGNIQADITTIDTESIPSIADTQANQGTSLYVNIALSALAAIGAIGALALS